jgi:hypothetical protein
LKNEDLRFEEASGRWPRRYMAIANPAPIPTYARTSFTDFFRGKEDLTKRPIWQKIKEIEFLQTLPFRRRRIGFFDL